ncbi:biotin-dependent carboxyltransferase family protein [Phycicoccus endophyticus]|uniref:5-oxoprolinase subunit C family protein n=1 Tax=Phycicoccus endophyticus TaxID=1690220 RepID=UPI00166AA4C8|nr:biotin-dependent carboxyltransferase family protein [Phycicoccus endophyticus]GGL34470.1 allophanate hydrolase [Phycicoccus endophyticus]
MSATLTVRATGPLALVEDLGRPGLAGIGVGRSGAADRASLRLANRVLGNEEGAAAVEVTAGGLVVEVGGEELTFCVTGARCPVTVDGRDVGTHDPVRVAVGSRVRLAAPTHGLRSYLAVRGGLDVPAVLGARSHDVLAHLGPAPLREGDVLPVRAVERPLPGVDHVPWPRWDPDVVLRAVRGPRADWARDVDVLTTTVWTASDRSNRVGMRLAGGRVEHAREEQLPSEGIWRGAVQVPPSGEPVLFLADHPVTGGYPVVAVVVGEDVDRAAQVGPGERLTFRWVEAP